MVHIDVWIVCMWRATAAMHNGNSQTNSIDNHRTFRIRIMSIMANMNVKLDTFNLHVPFVKAFCKCHFKTKFSRYLSLNELDTEEILGSNTAIWMSNDGHLMLYGTFK